MTQNNGTGSRPKVDPALGKEVRLRLLRDKPYIGQNGVGAYFLYSVLDLGDVTEKALFAPLDVHEIIESKGLKSGSEFILKKVAHQNGSKKITSRLELSLVGNDSRTWEQKLPSQSEQPEMAIASNGTGHANGNGYKETMLQCMRDAVDISKDPAFVNLPFRTEDIRSIGLTLFIARSKVQPL